MIRWLSLGVIVMVGMMAFDLFKMQSSFAQPRPDAPTYAQPGPYVVGTRELKTDDANRPLEVTIWYPTLNEAGAPVRHEYRYGPLRIESKVVFEAQPAAGPFPLIVFSHGNSGFRYQSLYYVEHLASHGFVVLSADHPQNTLLNQADEIEAIVGHFALRPADVLSQIALAEALNAEGDFAGVIDLENIGVTGHSFGGYTALGVGGAAFDYQALVEGCVEAGGGGFCEVLVDNEAVFASLRGFDEIPADHLYPALNDPRIKAIVPLAPSVPVMYTEATLAGVTAPMLILVGSQDSLTPLETDGQRAYDFVSSETKGLMVFENADHYIFVEKCNDIAIRLGFFESCSDAVWDMQRVHDLINHAATAFFLVELQGNTEAQAALLPANMDFRGVIYQTTIE